jgi:DNA-binding LacI/PurR family transcriptional regulator
VAYGDLAQRAGCDCVLTDPTRGVTMAIEHLIEMGHRQVGIGVGCIDYPTCQMRLDAALQTLKEAGLSPRPEHVIHGADPSMRGGHDVVMQMFKTGEMPTALFMGNDWMAMGAGHMLAVQGYKVPDHVSIVGYDNLDMAENYLPPLSTIDNRLEEVVEHAVVLLHKRLAGDTSFSKQVAIDAYPIWRQTTASPPRRQKTPPSLI